MLRKSMILLIVIVALVGASALAVSAQSTDPQPLPCAAGGMLGNGMMMGRGMMGQGMLNGGAPMLTVAAEALGLDETALVEALQSGQTLAEIADAQGVDLDVLQAAMVCGAQTHMAELVAAGVLTQAQVDIHLAQMSEHMADMPLLSGTGSCMMAGGGMMHMGRQGMMGQGMMNGGGMMGHGMGRHS